MIGTTSRDKNITGNAETPFLLARVNELTGGASLSSSILFCHFVIAYGRTNRICVLINTRPLVSIILCVDVAWFT